MNSMNTTITITINDPRIANAIFKANDKPEPVSYQISFVSGKAVLKCIVETDEAKAKILAYIETIKDRLKDA